MQSCCCIAKITKMVECKVTCRRYLQSPVRKANCPVIRTPLERKKKIWYSLQGIYPRLDILRLIVSNLSESHPPSLLNTLTICMYAARRCPAFWDACNFFWERRRKKHNRQGKIKEKAGRKNRWYPNNLCA